MGFRLKQFLQLKTNKSYNTTDDYNYIRDAKDIIILTASQVKN